MAAAAWSELPPIDQRPAPIDYSSMPRTSYATMNAAPAPATMTVGVWLIAILPLLQFAVVYLLFGPLKVSFAPGMQWGILAAPAAFSLLFANADRNKLIAEGAARVPSVAFAIIPPLYLVARCVTVGVSSIAPLIVWIALQAAAVAGAIYLLSAVLALALHATV
jgi:hypothetical protein